MTLSAETWHLGQSITPESLEYLALMDKTIQYTHLLETCINPKPGQKILDAGAGRGTLAIKLAQTYPEASIYGCDISLMAMKEATKQIPPNLEHKPTFFVTDIESGELPQEFYDTIYTSRVIQHLHNPLQCLKTIRQALTPGGRLILAEPHWYSLCFLDHPRFTDQFQSVIKSGKYIKYPFLAPTFANLLELSYSYGNVENLEKVDQIAGGPLLSQVLNFDLAKQISPEMSEALDQIASNPDARAEITMYIVSGVRP